MEEEMSAIGLCAPIKPGMSDEMRTFAKELGARMDEFAKARGSLPGNLNRESVWLMPTPMGDFLVAVLEGDDPVASNKALAESREPLDVWFKERALDITGVDYNQPLPPIEELYDYRA
jgi:hypothetical protein